MQARNEHTEAGNDLPETWTQEVKDLLNLNYAEQCKSKDKIFEVYGETYPTEVLIAASFLNKTDQLIIPVTFMVSADLEKNQNQEKLLKSLVDTLGMFFDKYFLEESAEEIIYQANWEEAEINKIKFWYKVTRENIGLTKMADDLLKS